VEHKLTGLGSALAAFLAFAITGVSGIWLVPYLKRLKFGQSIKEIGPVWHKAKQGTPIMGGLMFAGGITFAMLIVCFLGPSLLNIKLDIGASEKATLAGGIFMALIFGFIGFMDDYIKVVKKRNLGLTVKQKLILQVAAAAVFLFVKFASGDTRTTMDIPFTNIQWPMGIYLYVPLSIFIIVGTVNSVNLTDGVDGLCSSVTFVVAVAFMLCSKIMGHSGYAALSAALAGGCLGFLVWNFHPAKVFMGDTGSLFLGGLVCAIAYGINEPLILIPLGIIYMIETLSDIIQITSFKTTGKRVFKMCPIHHHFELSGWSENKIVIVFSLITVISSAAGVYWLALISPY
jgi:phospho-N-acetylmuramoyl-pentapeptide-transferase